MKKNYVIGLLGLLLVGCGSGVSGSGSTVLGSSGPAQESGTANTVVKEKIYVVNTNNTIAVGQIEADGTVKSFTTTPVAGISGNSGYASFMVADPSGNFLYVPQEGASGITQYKVNKSANTVAVNTPSSVSSGDVPNNAVFSKSGTCMFVGSDDNSTAPNVISSYKFDQATGVITQTGSAPAEISATQLVITSDDKFAYVPNFRSSTVSMFTLNDSTCILTPIVTDTGTNSNSINTYVGSTNPADVSHGPWAATISPDNKHLYVSDLYAGVSVPGSIAQYNIDQDTGALSFMKNNLVSASYSTGRVVFDQTGKYAYVPITVSSTKMAAILMFSVTSNGELTPLSTASIDLDFAQAGNATLMDLDSSGKFFYVTVGNMINIYTIGANGVLSKQGGIALTNSNADGSETISDIQFSTNSKFLYVQNSWDNKIYGYSINRENLATTASVLQPLGALPDTGGSHISRGLLIANPFNQATQAPYLWYW